MQQVYCTLQKNIALKKAKVLQMSGASMSLESKGKKKGLFCFTINHDLLSNCSLKARNTMNIKILLMNLETKI